MADASLDDFFAKKDKRTKKSKTKLTPTDLLAKQEPDQQKSVKKKRDKEKSQNRQTQSSSGTGTSTTVAPEDQEWKEFVEETETDYSGLRIQNLQISKEEEEEESDRRDSDDDGEGEDGKERREGKDGPWRKSSQPESTTQPPAPEPEPAPKVEEPKATGKYVPPSARYAATASATAPLSQMRRKKGAPNLKSEEDFPTLGGAGGGGPIRWGDSESGDRHFEQVRGGNKQMDEQSSKNMSLTLGNKFQALKQE